MFRGFNLNLTSNNFTHFKARGESLYVADTAIIRETVESFADENGTLNASELQANWFPSIAADVFISHSHKDLDLALSLAGWLYEEFALTAFIDSCVWGYADDLLEILDGEYCLNTSGRTFNYKKRNYSTSHVHLMLSTALSMMMDDTECIFFLNTPNSITAEEVISAGTKTASPWIYFEIAMTKLLRQRGRAVQRDNSIRKALNEDASSGFPRMEYDANLTHLTKLNYLDLYLWKGKIADLEDQHSLDVLYQLNPIKRKGRA